MRHAVVSLSTIVFVIACSPADRDHAEWAGSERDSAGVAIVENPLHGTWTDATRWRVEEDLRIGSATDDTLRQFGDIQGIGVGPDGRMLVLDVEADRPVRLFNSDGQFVTASGGRGSGPGEFQSGSGPVLTAGDSLFLIPDGSGTRTHIFDVDGRFQRTVQVALSEMIQRWGALSQGIPVVQLGLSMMPGMRHDDDLLDVLLAVGRDGADRDTLLTLPSSRQMFFEGGMPELTFFAAEPWWAVAADDAIWVGVNDRYAIGSYSGGSLRRLVTLPRDPVPVSEADREIVLDAWIQIFSRQMPNADAALRQLAQFADVFPLYQRFAVAPDGTLWVQQVQIPSQLSAEELSGVDVTKGWGSRTWDVFTPAGRLLGELAFPGRFEVMTFRGDHVYGVWRDEMDVPHLTRLRIVRGG